MVDLRSESELLGALSCFDLILYWLKQITVLNIYIIFSILLYLALPCMTHFPLGMKSRPSTSSFLPRDRIDRCYQNIKMGLEMQFIISHLITQQKPDLYYQKTKIVQFTHILQMLRPRHHLYCAPRTYPPCIYPQSQACHPYWTWSPGLPWKTKTISLPCCAAQWPPHPSSTE